MEVVLEVEHLGAVTLVDPLVLVLLPGGQVPAPVLRVDLVQVLGEEPVLLEVADAHQVGLVTVVVSVALKEILTNEKQALEVLTNEIIT